MPIINQVVSGGGSAPATQFGINIKGWCGDVDQQSGAIRTDQAVGTLSMPNLTQIDTRQWYYKFEGSSGLVGTLNLPDLQYVGDEGMSSAFANTGITGINFVQPLGLGYSALERAFQNTPLASVSLCINQLTDNCLAQTFYDCSSLRYIELAIDTTTIIDYIESYGYTIEEGLSIALLSMIDGCTNCAVHMYEDIWQEWIQYYDDQGETPPFSTESGWADWLTSIIRNDYNNHHGCSVVFDLSEA